MLIRAGNGRKWDSPDFNLRLIFLRKNTAGTLHFLLASFEVGAWKIIFLLPQFSLKERKLCSIRVFLEPWSQLDENKVTILIREKHSRARCLIRIRQDPHFTWNLSDQSEKFDQAQPVPILTSKSELMYSVYRNWQKESLENKIGDTMFLMRDQSVRWRVAIPIRENKDGTMFFLLLIRVFENWSECAQWAEIRRGPNPNLCLLLFQLAGVHCGSFYWLYLTIANWILLLSIVS